MDFEIKKFAFLYGDSEYFEWFKPNSKIEENFKSIMEWKGLHRGGQLYVEKAWDNWRNGTIDFYLPVTRAFFNHLKEPTKWPILDINAFNAMKKLPIGSKYKTNKNICNWKKDYENGYKKFFNELYTENEKQIDSIDLPNIDGIDREIIKRKVLDRALWEFGRVENSSFKKP